MSLHAMAWAKTITHGPTGDAVTRSEKLLLLVLADYYNGEEGCAWPSMSRLAREALMTERHARTLTQSLEAKGLVRIERVRLADGHNATNRYHLPALDAEALPGAAPHPSKATPVVDGPLTAADLADGLVGDGGVLDGYLGDFADAPVRAYGAALAAADILAAEHPGLSRNLRGFLRNAVVAHAAAEVAGIEGKGLARLYREAKALGADGHTWIVTALLSTASAAIDGDPTSYAIAAARRMKAEGSR
jgi:hypothetical protein